MSLTPRLQMLYDLVPPCGCVADVGTDHGYLLAALLSYGKCARGYGGDLNPGPLEAARRTFAEQGLTERAQLVLSDGFDRLPVDELDAAVLAGMGGELIADLVLRAPGLRAPGKTLVCQAMTRPNVLRTALCAAGFALLQEDVCSEDKHIYIASIFKYDGTPRRLSDAEARAGLLPKLEKPEAKEYLRRELALLRKIAKVENDRARATQAARTADALEALI